MRNSVDSQARRFSKKRRFRHRWNKVVTCLAAVVVFCTTYALILPAITLTEEPICGHEEHVHVADCFETPVPALNCSIAAHQHDTTCYDVNNDLQCGLADLVVHQHTDICYDGDGTLVCTLDEVFAHTHGEECYVRTETVHTHTDSCYTVTRGELACTLEEAHTHGEGCTEIVDTLICEIPENHVHGEECSALAQGCTVPEGHSHTDTCYLIEEKQVCTKMEGSEHTHEDACYSPEQQLTCQEQTEASVEQELVCTKQEILLHTHVDSCRDADGKLVCEMLQVVEHVHTDACTALILDEQDLTCTQPIDVVGEDGQTHVHTAECYKTLTCGQEAHTHDKVLCFSDPNADVETAEDWEKTLPQLSGNYEEDLVAVAQSQLGYVQSDTNVKVDAEGRIQNYTRYGAWYSDPYGDWDAMFVSFCLHYAEIPQEEFPIEADSDSWVMELKERDKDALTKAEADQTEIPAPLYVAASGHTPVPGNILFFDADHDDHADRVGIVAEMIEQTDTEPPMLKTIEGDTGNGCVEYQTYATDAPEILGYGVLPEKKETVSAPEQITLTVTTETVTAKAMFDEGVLPADAVMTVTPLPSNEEDILAMESRLNGRTVEAMYRFDITFTDAQGNELEPNGNVAVSIQFVEPLTAAAAAPVAEQTEDPQSVEWNLIHIPAEGETENLTNQESTVLQTSAGNSLEAFEFESGGFSEYVVLALSAEPQAAEVSLVDYLSNNGGTIAYNLDDKDGNRLNTDSSEAIEVVIGETYVFSFAVEAPNGIHPGDYFLQLPNGVQTTATGGTLVTGGTEIGTWSVDENGHISLHFNDMADSHQSIKFGGSFEVIFNEVDEPIEIDGNMIVSPKLPADETGSMWKMCWYNYPYDTTTWEPITTGGARSISWRITVVGSEGDTPVVGETITDRLGNDGEQLYDPEQEPISLEITTADGVVHGNIVISTAENIEAGIFKWITNDAGDYVGWEYTVPETIACTGDECAEDENRICKGDGSTVLTLEDEDWKYYFRCESYPKDAATFDPNGNYYNTAFKSNNPTWHYTSNTGTPDGPAVVKNASYNAVRDQYEFDATITIPGGMKGTHFSINDDMKVLDASGADYALVDNTIAELETVTMYIGETSYTIPFLNVADALRAGEDPKSARNAWFAAHQNYSTTPYVLIADSFEYQEVDGEYTICEYRYEFWKWCDCTEDTCVYGGKDTCDSRNGFCRCWNVQEDVTIRFQYTISAKDLNDSYGGQGMKLENDLEIHWFVKDANQSTLIEYVEGVNPTVDIPGMIAKTEMTRAVQENEYTAVFGITLNQMLQDWSRLEEVVIHDEMSQSLTYIPGTLEITRDDDPTPLVLGEDYAFEAVTGGHGFVLTLLDPQQSVYHMQYSAMVNQAGIDIQNPGYNNKAWVTVDDTNYHSSEINTNLTNFTFTAKSYSVTVYKVDQNDKPLDGVVFGLFAENGELIQEKTVTNGSVTFSTSVTEGIIFQTHSKYYIQELVPKPGYTPDYTKYMFYFCEQDDCTEETEGVIHFGAKGELTVGNALGGYELPNTGGPGVGMYSMGGLLLILSAAYLLLNKVKSRGKEDNGFR